MKLLALALLALAAGVALAFWADEAAATTTCQNVGGGPTVANTCRGYAHVSTSTGGIASQRCFAFRTVNSAPTCSSSGITPATTDSWQIDAGSCITLYYFDVTNGGAPPAAPNQVTLQVYHDNAATATITLLNAGAEPANGTGYSFCATSDGLVTGSPRAGTWRPFVRPQKTNGVGGVGNYDISSDGLGSPISFDRAAIRGGLVASSISTSAYPSGSTFAYGPAGDETITITSSFTTPNVDNGNRETMRNLIVDEATLGIGQAGATVDVDSGSLAQGFVADSSFPFSGNPYVAGVQTVGTAGLTGLLWSHIAAAGHGAGIVVFSDSFAYQSADIAIDYRIKADSDCTGGYASADEVAVVKLGSSSGSVVSKFNKGETYHADLCLYNARSELLSRAMTFAREDATPTTCASLGSVTPTSNHYAGAAALSTGSTCLASGDPGSDRYFRITNTDQNYRSLAVFTVSPVLYLDSHTQVASTLDKDDFPTEDADEYFTYLIREVGGADASDTFHGWCHVKSVRKDTEVDTSGNAVSAALKDPTTATRASLTGDTGSDGWTPSSVNLLTSTPIGPWTFTCTATFNGNTGTDVENVDFGIEGGGGGDTMADPLKVFPAWKEGYLNQTNLLSISAMFLDGTARLDAEDELLVDIYDPAAGALVTGASPTEVGGGIYRYTFAGGADPGDYLVVIRNTDPETMGGATSNAFTVQNATGNASADIAAILASLSEHRESTIEVLMTSDFATYGFDGTVFIIGWLILFAVFLRGQKLLSAAVASIGLVLTLFQLWSLLVLAAALLVVSLWLEAIGKDHIVTDYFRPSSQRKPRA